MPIQFAWTPNKLVTGTYYARIVAQGTTRTEDIVNNIAKRTLIQPVDVHAVLDALDDEIVDALLTGNSVILDGFLGFQTSLELNEPSAATDPMANLSKDDARIRVNATVKSALSNRVEAFATLEQTATRVRSPQILEILDLVSQEAGKYTVPGVIELRGRDLDLPEGFEADPNQGVFFIDAASVEYRATVYVREGNKLVSCMVPAGVAGQVDIELRTNYGGPELRSGRYDSANEA